MHMGLNYFPSCILVSMQLLPTVRNVFTANFSGVNKAAEFIENKKQKISWPGCSKLFLKEDTEVACSVGYGPEKPGPSVTIRLTASLAAANLWKPRLWKQAGMQLQEQLCHCKRILHYKQELPWGILSKNLEGTILCNANLTKHRLK